MPAGLDWQREQATWPHSERSRFVDAVGIRWHVQQWPAAGQRIGTARRRSAPHWLLLHGTGASTHSWRSLAPLLAAHGPVLALDLPGHGFSSAAPPGQASLPGMAAGVAVLLEKMGVAPTVAVGHSAGAAVAVQMALMQTGAANGLTPELQAIVGLNAALLPLPGLSQAVLSPMAKLLTWNPLVPHFVAWQAGGPTMLRRLLAATGSVLDDEGTALYARLVGNAGHVAGALAMMAAWDLPALARELPTLRVPLHLMVGARDGTVPPSDGARTQAMVAGATLTTWPRLGHLAHEEQPAEVAASIAQVLGL